jgi:hypothetical protein
MPEMRNTCIVLVQKPDGKKPLGRHRHRWEDNIKIFIGDSVWAWIGFSLAQYRVPWQTLLNLQIP